jgi:hypothetical protein
LAFGKLRSLTLPQTSFKVHIAVEGFAVMVIADIRWLRSTSQYGLKAVSEDFPA